MDKLFWADTEHVEIGELADERSLQHFLSLCRAYRRSFGVHSPLFRGGSKYDLLEAVDRAPEIAWAQVEHEAVRVATLGGEYLLVHFPYFQEVPDLSAAHKTIRHGLERLSRIQKRSGTRIVCEPKLGKHRSPAGIEALRHLPAKVWAEQALSVCIDVGDCLIAAGPHGAWDCIQPLLPFVRVVHLHNVEFWQDGRYIWVPPHPSHESDGIHFPLQEILGQLATLSDVVFVFEHTPHSDPSDDFVMEGFEWIRSLVGG